MQNRLMIKILFFGSIADRLGERESELPIHENMTVEGVVSAVGCDGFRPLLVAVNQEQITDCKVMKWMRFRE